jgi:hypothetical protein
MYHAECASTTRTRPKARRRGLWRSTRATRGGDLPAPEEITTSSRGARAIRHRADYARTRTSRGASRPGSPTSSSWLNQVERWFGELTTKLLQRGVHTSVQALEADIRNWIKTWNENPRPFAWTKTADEILEALSRNVNESRAQDTSP